jgi:hypothetical protein
MIITIEELTAVLNTKMMTSFHKIFNENHGLCNNFVLLFVWIDMKSSTLDWTMEIKHMRRYF